MNSPYKNDSFRLMNNNRSKLHLILNATCIEKQLVVDKFFSNQKVFVFNVEII